MQGFSTRLLSITGDALLVDIIKAIAAIENVPARELEPPLYQAIDPDALERLVDGSTSLIDVTFEYAQYKITIDTEEAEIVITESS